MNNVKNPAGEISVNSSYDGLNRVVSSTHPYIGTSGVTERTFYGGLGRNLGMQHPDGQVPRSAYGPNVGALGGLSNQQSSAAQSGYAFPIVSIDEAGKQKQQWIDGFGHVIEVDEPSSNITTHGTATITVAGSEGSTQSCDPANPDICHIVWDSGHLTVTVNGFVATAYWGKLSTAASVAASLAGALNSPESPVTAAVNGTAVTMTAGGPGAYAISFQQTFLYNDFTFSPTSGTLTGGAGGLLSSPNPTTYTYDPLGNLRVVAQGVQTRTYQYDGLGRLTLQKTPEVSTTTNGVTVQHPETPSFTAAAGTFRNSNPSNPSSRTPTPPHQTGTATITTTYTYNTANQLKQKTHSDTTGTEVYTYGTSASSFNIGPLIVMTDPSGSQSYISNTMGRVRQLPMPDGSTTYTMAYAYNSGGQLTQTT